MTWKTRLYAGIGEWVRENHDVDCVEVTYVEEWVAPVDCIITDITYRTRFGKEVVYTYDGSLMDIVDSVE